MTDDHSRGLLDTSVFVAREHGAALGPLPRLGAVSVVTLAELHLGVLAATQPEIRAQRLRTFATVQRLFDPLGRADRRSSAFAAQNPPLAAPNVPKIGGPPQAPKVA